VSLAVGQGSGLSTNLHICAMENTSRVPIHLLPGPAVEPDLRRTWPASSVTPEPAMFQFEGISREVPHMLQGVDDQEYVPAHSNR
jgi:hypothetical protein